MVGNRKTVLLKLIEKSPAFGSLVAGIKTRRKLHEIVCLDVAKSYTIAALHSSLSLPFLVVTAHPERSRELQEQIAAWNPGVDVFLYPEAESLPYQRVSTDNTALWSQMEVLYRLAENSGSDCNCIVVMSINALARKTISANEFISVCRRLAVGEEINPRTLIQHLQHLGYTVEPEVIAPGMVSRRGGILDIFMPSGGNPVRLEFWGNTIDSIRSFDAETQRSLGKLDAAVIMPAAGFLVTEQELFAVRSDIDFSNCTDEARMQFERELDAIAGHSLPDEQFYQPLFAHSSVLEFVPEKTVVILDEPEQLQETLTEYEEKADELRSEKTGKGELPQNWPVPYFNWGEVSESLNGVYSLSVTKWESSEKKQTVLPFQSMPEFNGRIPEFIDQVKKETNAKNRIIVASHQAERLSELLYESGIITTPVKEVTRMPSTGSVTLVQGDYGYGWKLNSLAQLYTDTEIFGFVKKRRPVKKRVSVARKKLLDEVRPGDYMVHIEHGVGQFTGIQKLNDKGFEREYLVLQYAEGDTLYVPVDQIDRVSRYIGAADHLPAVNRLGTQEWSRTKRSVKEAVEEVAEDLLRLYASREVVQGYAFSPDTVWQQEMEASFPYMETPDQLRSLREVKRDMTGTKPMDRLICGDVGYGKTEIAIRAAFKAVMDNKQVAVLVPTTVLAQQHYVTFQERLAAFPVTIGMLSRFRTAGEQKAIIDGIGAGTIDVCIGTHRLLQRDVKFKDLGLLIIDEEQRFGVAHKEYLKKMRKEVDVLTLTATPIPRTLHLSLVGVRDMSTLETPPEERLPIKTYVAPYSDSLVREAIIRELERDGQVFFVHNRVNSIRYIADKLQLLVPEARISVGHGQMNESELESVMSDFSQGKSDILVCTTIIESGLDIPDANTILINNADRMGLTQLYQLRGRIGRGANLAYAYLLYERDKKLTPVAAKRLQTIYEAAELGAGFGVAMRDLEIRGAGTLLGTRQSGHISAVGFTLYTQMLAEAVENARVRAGESVPEQKSSLPEPSINLPLAASIPESYVEDIDARLELYQRLSQFSIGEEYATFMQELRDRFGAMPEETENLLYLFRVRMLAMKAGVETIFYTGDQITIKLHAGLRFERARLHYEIGDRVAVYPEQARIHYNRSNAAWKDTLTEFLVRSLGKFSRKR